MLVARFRAEPDDVRRSVLDSLATEWILRPSDAPGVDPVEIAADADGLVVVTVNVIAPGIFRWSSKSMSVTEAVPYEAFR